MREIASNAIGAIIPNRRPGMLVPRSSPPERDRGCATQDSRPNTRQQCLELLVDEQEKKVRLTEKETAILKYLYRAGAKVVGRDVLLAEVWGYNSGVTTHTLETHIYRLRQKIEKDPSNAEILVTETGGYRLVP